MTTSGIRESIRDFITRNYLGSPGLGIKRISDDDSFLKLGIVDSIGVIELVAFIQKAYGVKVEVAEILPENFDTVRNLEKYISKKKGGA
ncbi:MAG: acyl carrier protein [Candidatus Omnitrophica bacterium]|nr:acyl carrier protein [Candidatus Omnitrophota bacterium]MDD5489017.1 acyl carrier protein [Candidatus Omnitrophota bacterium]